jgi:hypothetical protein
MTTPDDKNKINPEDQYNQQATDYRKQATDYNKQAEAYDQQVATLPAFDHEKFYEDWQSGKKPIVEALMSNYKKPEQQITPEQAEKAKIGAALTDSLSSLAEIVASGRGAHIRNRGNDPTSTQTTNQRLEQLKNKYDQEMLNYNNTKGNAEMKDFSEQLEDAMKEKGQQRQYLLYKSKESKANAKEAQKEANQQQKNAADYAIKLQEQGLKGKEFDEKMNEFKQKQSVDWYDAQTKRQNSKKYTGSLQGASPEEYIQVNEKAETLPKPWLIQKGYMHQVPGKSVVDPPTYRWDSKATPAIKRALIDLYEQEQGAGTQGQTQPPVQWKKPVVQNTTTGGSGQKITGNIR